MNVALMAEKMSAEELERVRGWASEGGSPYNRALGALVAHADALQREADGMREALGDLIEVADGTLAMLEAKREAGDFNHWESFEMSDFAVAINTARAAALRATISKSETVAGNPIAQGEKP